MQRFTQSRRVIKPPRKPIVKSATMAAPIQGINSRDPLAAMDATSAIAAINFVATPQGLSVRQGWRKHATGIEGYVTSLLTYKGQGATADKLFACAGGSIYDVTAPSATPPVVATGKLSAYWDSTMMTTNGGNFLIACNGIDEAMFYDGTSWENFGFEATPDVPGEITTGSLADFDSWKQVIVHQRRLWMVERDSTIAHYLPIDSMGGAAVSFDFGPVFPRGGTLHALASWAIDNGLGIQSYLVAVSSAGDVAIYGGKNPADASNWALTGTWQLAEPVGQKCLTPFSGDLLYLSLDGLQPLSVYMKSKQDVNAGALTLMIQNDINVLVSAFRGLKGFEVRSYPGQNVLILNVPQINADQNFQYCYHSITKGWTVFTGIPAQTWALLNNRLYLGHNGGVGVAFQGYRDGADPDGQNGTPYIAAAQQAFSYFSEPGIRKRFVMAKPHVISAVAQPKIRIGCNVDFKVSLPTGTVNYATLKGSVWDTGLWDNSAWTSGSNTFSEWQSFGEIGTCASLTFAVSVTDETLWAATDWVFELGGLWG